MRVKGALKSGRWGSVLCVFRGRTAVKRYFIVPLHPIYFNDIRIMNRIKLLFAAIILCHANSVLAGGLLTNTNQNIVFLRNPARDAAIGIDGVYSNPAGVSFLRDGFHLSINIQNAHQTRSIRTAYGNIFQYNTKYMDSGMDNRATAENGYSRLYKGNADAPILPSLQAATPMGGAFSLVSP